jgi:hypothetical protein
MPDRLSKIIATGFGVAACLAVALALSSVEVAAHYIAFMPAITAACAFGGLGLALWAIGFSAIGIWFFFLPAPEYNLICGLAHLGIFVGVAIFVCWIIDSLRRSNDALSRDNVILGCKVSTLLSRVHTAR